MIKRAGRSLRSLKLGIVYAATTLVESPMTLDCSGRKSNDAFRYYRPEERSFVLTKYCLLPLSVDGGSIGALLTRLHLYQINKMDNTSLCTALSSCPSLTDLGIVSLRFDLCQALETVSKCCPLLEHLYLDSSRTVRSILRPPTCADLVKNCPHIYSLALRGFELDDSSACALVKGFRKLKFLDFSTSNSITGSFLENIDGSSGGNLLEVLILRDSFYPEQMEVSRFLSAVISGEFEYLRYLDISNLRGLASEGGLHRQICDTSSMPVAQLLEERREFPSPDARYDYSSDEW